MNKLYIRTVKGYDLFTLARYLQPEDVDQYTEFTGEAYNSEAVADRLMKINGPAWTIADSDTDIPLAAGGFEWLRPGVARSWFLATPWTWQYAEEVTEICRATIINMMDSAHRLETVSLSNRAKAHRWYELIGLTREAEHPGYGVTGQSAVTYVRVR